MNRYIVQYLKQLNNHSLHLVCGNITKSNSFTLNKYSTMSILTFDKQLKITQGNDSLTFSYLWLRDHCRCEACYNQLTFQRKFNVTDIDLDIKPKDCCIQETNNLIVNWENGHHSNYEISWLKKHTYETYIKKYYRNYKLWTKDEIVRTFSVAHVPSEEFLSSENGVLKLMTSLVDYGIGFVENVVADLENTEKVIRRISHVQHTLFGGMWEFSDKLDHSDTAYTKEELGAHTDNTYFTEAAGLQVLHCLNHEGAGGENFFVDGFKALEILKKNNIETFNRLTSTCIEAEYVESGYHHSYCAPIIKINPVTETVEQIRFNLNDRAPLSLPRDQIDRHYADLKTLASVIKDPDLEWKIKLNPGTVVFFDNFRVLHGRKAYTGRRTMCGSYVGRTDFLSKARVLKLIEQ